MFHLQSSLTPPDLAILTQACVELTSPYELGFLIFATSQNRLACAKKVERFSRNLGCHNGTFLLPILSLFSLSSDLEQLVESLTLEMFFRFQL